MIKIGRWYKTTNGNGIEVYVIGFMTSGKVMVEYRGGKATTWFESEYFKDRFTLVPVTKMFWYNVYRHDGRGVSPLPVIIGAAYETEEKAKEESSHPSYITTKSCTIELPEDG